ncbi:cyclic-phosphate processing receiver domain-containing protein [Pleionea litopenaei]|uniref:Cyclic-phosphate processing Receiver domain-containing protein n=1 Tax=Pleionea litopenaei TaxID=3070815 RepID=A0AA51X6P1_9GAMM|nr:cyclic-phosphate processing receiver domain-containing protein [Pleionea sp. HL-JVS1]WMS87041.1 hypothetical protein Q9312_17670 [Pleionea sp. HL-JVS1]
MKLFLDDVRPAPAGWKGVRWPQEAISLLMTGSVTDLSLDHDLGNDQKGTGYDVIVWLEKAVVEYGLIPPSIRIHSSNGPARKRMEQGVRSIQYLHRTRGRKLY